MTWIIEPVLFRGLAVSCSSAYFLSSTAFASLFKQAKAGLLKKCGF